MPAFASFAERHAQPDFRPLLKLLASLGVRADHPHDFPHAQLHGQADGKAALVDVLRLPDFLLAPVVLNPDGHLQRESPRGPSLGSGLSP